MPPLIGGGGLLSPSIRDLTRRQGSLAEGRRRPRVVLRVAGFLGGGATAIYRTSTQPKVTLGHPRARASPGCERPKPGIPRPLPLHSPVGRGIYPARVYPTLPGRWKCQWPVPPSRLRG